jgi:hypothetical protein
MNNINYIRSFLLVSSLSILSGCSLVSESVRLSVEDTKLVQSGATVQGDGFSVRVPESGFYLVRNSPMHGDLCLRMRGDWPGSSYNVYPFTLPIPASSLQTAWQAHVAQHTTHHFVRDYRIVAQHTNVWQGSVSWFQTGYIPSAFLTANCVTSRGTNYFWIARSVELFTDTPDARDISRAEHGLQVFLDGFQFDQRPNTALEPAATAP